jgi:hypothetical protein
MVVADDGAGCDLMITPTPKRRRPGARPEAPARRGIDWFDLAVLAALAGLSMWVLVLDVYQVVAHDRTWTGTDGGYGLPDQMQHLAWVRDASSHLLVSNLFVLEDTPHNYLQPAVVVSAALAALGVPPWVALLLWKPAAVVMVFATVRTYVHRTVDGVGLRRAALVLALFFIGWGGLISRQLAEPGSNTDLGWQFHTFDAWLAFWSWGYVFGLLSVATLAGALLAYGRGRAARRVGWAAPTLAALTGWIHPWQGEVLILVLVVTEVVMAVRGDRPRLRVVAVTLLAAALPFAYYAGLRHTDPSWRAGQDIGRHAWPIVMVLLTLLPLALPAAFTYRTRARTFLGSATRVWPLVALALYLLNETPLGRGPTHILLGVTVPLAVLSVEGARWLSRRLHLRRAAVVGTALIAVLLIPPTLYAMKQRKDALFLDAGVGGSANFVAPGERRALAFLDHDARPGGVIANVRLGTVVPALTGRHTYIGNYYWSRGYLDRLEFTDTLFNPKPERASDFRRAVDRVTRMRAARFVLADCRATADLRRELGPAVERAHRFGCATVYVLRR